MKSNGIQFKSLISGVVLTLGLIASAAPALAQYLVFDKEHDVLVLPDCQVTVRFNNKSFVPIKAKRLDLTKGTYLDRPVLRTVKIAEDFSNVSIATSPEEVTVECYEVGDMGNLTNNRFSKDYLNDNNKREVTLTSARIAKETGLPLSAVTSLKAVKCYQIKPKSGSQPYNLFAFQHDKYITFYARKMRSGSTDMDTDPIFIVTELRLGPTTENKASIEMGPPKTAQ